MMCGYTLLIKALGVNELSKIKVDEKKKMKKVNKQESERKYKRQNKKEQVKEKKTHNKSFIKKLVGSLVQLNAVLRARALKFQIFNPNTANS